MTKVLERGKLLRLAEVNIQKMLESMVLLPMSVSLMLLMRIP